MSQHPQSLRGRKQQFQCGWVGHKNYFSAKSNFNEKFDGSLLSAGDRSTLSTYLDDHIDEVSNVLYMIERFKLKAEWFKRIELLQSLRK